MDKHIMTSLVAVQDKGWKVKNRHGQMVADCHTFDQVDRHREAYARLFAAAPELYASIKELVRCVRGGDETSGVSMDDALIAADEAISKAETRHGS